MSEHRPAGSAPGRCLRSLEDITPNAWITPLKEFKIKAATVTGNVLEVTVPANGIPLRVMAVDLPFLVVRTPEGHKWTLDARDMAWKILDRDYVLEVLAAHAERRPQKGD